ncbi:MAG: error-prone DNA polymerase [Actinomycetaceae bacterium]|nr:error-prone DNA polymerase [Actinomycetaceae bacterium]
MTVNFVSDTTGKRNSGQMGNVVVSKKKPQDKLDPVPQGTPHYAELHAYSAYSFLHGVTQPFEMVKQAKELGLFALGITDRDGFYAVSQLHQASKQFNLPIVYGAELPIEGFGWLPVLAIKERGYRKLSQAISDHHLHAGKRDSGFYSLDALACIADNSWIVLTGNHMSQVMSSNHQQLLRGTYYPHQLQAAITKVCQLKDAFGPHNVFIENCRYGFSGEHHQTEILRTLSRRTGIPIVGASGATCAYPHQQKLADLLAVTRLNTSLERGRRYLPATHGILRSPLHMAALHDVEELSISVEIAKRCSFDWDLLAPKLPSTDVPQGYSQSQWLRHRTYQGAYQRYGSRASHPQAWQQIDNELDVISRLGFDGYFLIVDDIVQFCRSNNIMCQGRGSAANSAVCFALGITAVDAVKYQLLFERFLSENRRHQPPDIDIDIESGRREEVIQYVYNRYGRQRAALVATVISYRTRSAIRDVSRALGYDSIENDSRIDNHPQQVVELSEQLKKLPRHMGIHPGGMVLCEQPVTQICPVNWGAMKNRSVLQWDKEDCAEAGLVKFDLLGLGMLTALHKAFDSIEARGITAPNGTRLDLHNIPQEDPQVFELLQRADTVGVFQVESRAQMNTLPRMKPACFYDIVIEVALVRPGPIQGEAINPYLRRRQGKEPVTYVHPSLIPALKKTLGVPIFQEQLMRIAVDGAGFSPAQADELRKAMGSKRSRERMQALKTPLFNGMVARGFTCQQMDQVWQMLHGFAAFGFPESHSFSFAYIVYASAWLKVHYPADFYAALLASQPMGFYSAQSLVADARRRGITVRSPDVNFSLAKASVEFISEGEPALRLGLESIRGLSRTTMNTIVDQRDTGFSSIEQCVWRCGLTRKEATLLAGAKAFGSIEPTRSQALWTAGIVRLRPPTPWYQMEFDFTKNDLEVATAIPVDLPPESPQDALCNDIKTTGVSTQAHPMSLMRHQLQGICTAQEINTMSQGGRVKHAGVITHRQRPSTAKGITFLSLEDETGLVNVMCSQGVWQHYRVVATYAKAVIVRGRVEVSQGAHVIHAEYLEELKVPGAGHSRDFR